MPKGAQQGRAQGRAFVQQAKLALDPAHIVRWGEASQWRQGRLLALLAIVVYTPAIALGGFVWDDWIFVHEPLVRRLDGIVSIWLSPAEIARENHYWPMVYTSFWLEHKLWGFNPVGYHAVNVALHAVNSVLVWRVLRRLDVPGAWLAGAVFAVHPVHVESVAWIIERKDLLSALFYLCAIHVWLRFSQAPGPGRYLLCGALFGAALLSKSIVVTLPAALLLLRWWQTGRVTWRDGALIAPLVALSAGVTLADLAFYRDRVDSAIDFSLVERALIAARALMLYAHQLVWPASLPVLYSRWDVHAGDVVGWLAVAALVALGAALWLARHRIGRGALAGVAFFVLTLSPVLGFVDFRFMQMAFIADRFQYLASIGLIAVVVGAVVHLAGRSARSRAAVPVMGAAVVVALGALCWRQSGVYADDLTFARHIAKTNPSHYAGQSFLSNGLRGERRYEEALEAARRGVALAERAPGSDTQWAYAALGASLLALDHAAEAEAAFRTSLARWSRSEAPTPRLALAQALVAQARYDEALALIRTVIRAHPANDEAHRLEGLALLASGHDEDAAASFERALGVLRRLDTEASVHASLAEALQGLGRHAESAAHLERALERSPNNIWFALARVDVARERERAAGRPGREGRASVPVPRWSAQEVSRRLAETHERCLALVAGGVEPAYARVALGEVRLRMSDLAGAETALEEALALRPARPIARHAHRALGAVFEAQERLEAAGREWQSALAIHPFDAEALEGLGAVRMREGRYADAAQALRRLTTVRPGDANAHAALSAVLRRKGAPQGVASGR